MLSASRRPRDLNADRKKNTRNRKPSVITNDADKVHRPCKAESGFWRGQHTQFGHATVIHPLRRDFGLLGNAEALQVTQSNPMNGPVCD